MPVKASPLDAYQADQVLLSYASRDKFPASPAAPNGIITVCTTGGCDHDTVNAAIIAANPFDTIDVGPEVFTETLVIQKSLTIQGAGSENTIIQAAGDQASALSRVIEVDPDIDVTINGVTIQYGKDVDGGGIYNQGALTLTNSIVYSNSASGDGGGIMNHSSTPSGDVQLTIIGSTIQQNSAGTDGSESYGGGIFNMGEAMEATLHISGTTIISNTAKYGAGIGIYSTFGKTYTHLTNVNILGNTTFSSGQGGGIRSRTNNLSSISAITLISTTLENNQAHIGGGIALFALGGETSTDIISSTISNNVASNDGGGIYNQGALTLTNSTIISNTSNSRGGGITNYAQSGTGTANIQIFGSSITGNGAVFDGGGIYNYGVNGFTNVNLHDTIVSNNNAEYGAGIYNYSNGNTAVAAMILTRTTVSGNSSVYSGGGIGNEALKGSATLEIIDSTVKNNTCEDNGGGLYSQSSGGNAIINIANSTISNNTTGESGSGGGIYIYGYSGNSNTFLSNTTMSGNSANSAGGIYQTAINGYSNFSIVASTIYTNTATFAIGGIFNTSGTGTGTATMTMTHSIVSNSAVNNGDCDSFGSTADFNNTGYNIIGNDVMNHCGTFFYTGNPILGNLLDNGGPTFTHALLEGSPAIDAIPSSSCLLMSDQRGVTRPLGYGCDIGAYEVENYLLFLPLIMR